MQRENYSEVVCRYCGKHFLLLNSRIRRGNGKFCSKKCAGKDKTKKITRICPTCGKSFLVFAYKIKEGKGKFCSLKCYSDYTRRSYIDVTCKTCGRVFQVSKNRYNAGRGIFCSKQCKNDYTPKQKKIKCDYCGKEYIAKESELNRNTHHYCCTICAHKDYRNHYSEENSANWNKSVLKGEKSPNWKGGSQRDKHNGNYKYVDWRTSVFERDNYTCQECGQVGGKLNAHHILPWAKHIAFRYELWNGITLCESCHKQEHKRLRKEAKMTARKGDCGKNPRIGKAGDKKPARRGSGARGGGARRPRAGGRNRRK